MKFLCEVELRLSMPETLRLYDNVEHLDKWQTGFVSHEHISGEKDKTGAKSKVLFRHNNRDMELIETIVRKDLPEEFTAIYEHKHMVNTMYCHFEEIEKDKTLFQMEIEYTKFIGFMPKLIAFLMPSMFRKQSQKYLDQFKEFAESYGA